MKKYRLKEEVKKYFKERFWNREERFEWWQNNSGASPSSIEKVPQRVELYWFNAYLNLQKRIGNSIVKPFTEQEKELCEKALNGELFTKDDMDEYLCFCDGKIKTVDEWLQHKQDEHVIGQSENYQER